MNILTTSIGDSLITAVLGYAVVFSGLIALMLVLIVMSKAFTIGSKKKPTAEPAVELPVAAEPEIPEAPGTAGQLKLHNVEPKTAAMLMAIVANKMGKPINELRFISIKEVE
jgi:Na+-transporting methylmalonyl-CoA/oxaloacetate decarboxylase gamma subunit